MGLFVCIHPQPEGRTLVLRKRATEIHVARDKLQGKLEKFKKFTAYRYLKDSSEFNFQLPEPRAWPDGKSDGSDADGANTRSSGSKVGGAGAGRHDKVPAIMQLVFDTGAMHRRHS